MSVEYIMEVSAYVSLKATKIFDVQEGLCLICLVRLYLKTNTKGIPWLLAKVKLLC